MGWLRKILGIGEPRDETEALFERLNEFLNSDATQNAALPTEVRALLQDGKRIDQLEGATGEYGRTLTNPIPVNSPIGEVTYISALVLADGRDIWAHRISAVDRIDIYEAVSEDGKDWFLFFMAPYYAQKTSLTPSGFDFRDQPRVRGILATNQTVPDFPKGLPHAIREWTKATIGLPLPSPGLREALDSSEFIRPSLHASVVEAIQTGSAATNDERAVQIFLGWTHNKLYSPFLSVLRNTLGYDAVDVSEVMMFCTSIVTYCYLRYGPPMPDHTLLDEYQRRVIEDFATGVRNQNEWIGLFQQRYQEYAALIAPVLDPSEDQRHQMTTLLMHACERSSGESAQGRMIKIAMSSQIIAAMLDDAFKFAKQRAKLAATSD